MDTYTIGVDLGGTKVAVALVDERGRSKASDRFLTEPDQGPDAVIDKIVSASRACTEGVVGKAVALGVGIAGQVRAGDGGVEFAPNLRWRNVPFRSKLEAALELPVVVTNDVRAAAWGERTHGAGRGVDDMVCVFVGTGVGGGIVAAGRLLEGHTNTAGELGHVTVVADGRPCRCPHRGCLEAYAGGWAIAERAQEAVREDAAAGAGLVSIAGSVERITAEIVSEAFRRKDPLAVRLVKETGHYLAVAAAGFVNAFNPSLLVLGGGVVEGLPALVDAVVEYIPRNALAAAVQNFRIVKAKLAGDAGVIGAAALARDMVASARD